MIDLEIIGQGATTKIYLDGNTAIKLYVNVPIDEVENEAERQRFAYDAGLSVPAVFGVRRLDESTVTLDMEYINGQPLIHAGMDKDERRKAIGVLARLQCMVHKVHAIGQPKQTERLAWKIKHTHYLDEPQKDRLLALLERLSSNYENLCHGDFHPLNILYDGSKYWIIDWVDMTAGNPLADACRTYIIFLEHMKRSAGIYLHAFCTEENVNPEDVLAWLPVIAAARLTENIGDKSKTLLLDLIKNGI